MEPPDFEEALQIYLTGVLLDQGDEQIPVVAAHRAEELAPFGTSVVCICREAEHAAGPLWTPTAVVLVTTPILPLCDDDNLARHRRIGRICAEAFAPLDADAFTEAVLEACSAAHRGVWAADASTYREEGRWCTAFQLTCGLEQLDYPESFELGATPDTFEPGATADTFSPISYP